MEAMFKVLFHIFFILLVLVNSVWTQSPVRRLSSGIERTALLDLRTSLGIKARYWPKKLDPCTNWTGVECDNGRVTGINLSGLRRTRFVSPSFSVNSLVRCTQLVYFNSSGFALQGQIPDWLGRNLSALQVLDLTSSSVLGPIPPSIGSLNRLNRLLLSDNSLTGIIPDSLLQLSSLSVLNLSLNMLTGSIPSSFSALSNLSTLDLSSNFLSGPIPTGFGSISSLRFLNLSNNSLASTLPIQLSKLSQLIDLDLGFNSFTGSVPTEIEHLRNLRRFSIRNNNFGGNLPSNFTKNIILLDVSSNNLTGNLPNLSSFPNASGVTLNFSNNNFYGILNSSVPTPESIDLSNNYLQGFNGNIGNKTIISRNCFLQIQGQRTLDDCRTFYRLRNLPFNGDSFPDSIPPVQPQFRRNRTNHLKYVLAGVFGGIGVFIIGFILLFLLLKTCNKRTVNQRSANVEPIQEGTEKSQTISVNIFDSFSYEQLSQATSGFSDTNLVKRGHSGDMFSGKLEDGVSVVIKRVDMRNSRKDCYMRELELYGKGAHTRLVPLLGHCLGHETEKMLVYKFMPNGDLSNSLYRSNSLEDSGLQSLDWITRLKIAIGAAEGLVYLHHECNPPIVHRDIQASSILLDDKYEVRLGSLSEVCVQGVEDNPNVITKLLRISSNSEPIPSGSSSSPPICSYDVYCFGKVLLELVTGRIGINNSEWVDQTLTFINNYDKELVSKIIDQSLVIDEDLMEEVWAVAIVAKSCLNPKPSKRPQMAHILKALENPFRVVREEDFSSGRLRNNSSRRSWSAALFGSWRQSYSGSTHSQSQKSREGVSGQKRDNSQGSGTNDKKFSSEIFPEPVDINDVERQDGTRS